MQIKLMSPLKCFPELQTILLPYLDFVRQLSFSLQIIQDYANTLSNSTKALAISMSKSTENAVCNQTFHNRLSFLYYIRKFRYCNILPWDLSSLMISSAILFVLSNKQIFCSCSLSKFATCQPSFQG